MFLFGSHEDALHAKRLALLDGSLNDMNGKLQGLWPQLSGEERPGDMMVLLALLVVLLHLWLFQWLNQSNDETTPPKQQVMAVSMITIAAPKPAVAPVQPAPPPPEAKPLPKKTPPKPVEKKPPPIRQKAPDFAPSEPVSEPKVEQSAAPSAVTSNSATNVASPTPPAPIAEEYVTAKQTIKEGEKSKPTYPKVAFNRGWTGKGKLRLHISADGKVIEALILESSGHDLLDEAALEWAKETAKFLPATRGGIAIDDWVNKPFEFKISNKSE